MSNILAVAEPDSVKEYKSVLCRFMAFKHNRPYHFTAKGKVKIDAYPKDHQFTQDELVAITPTDVTRWLSLMAYNKTDPTSDDLPIYANHNTLLVHKKSLSYFMPRQMHKWDDVREEGNPTKSARVNKLLKVVEKMETRGEGKKSNADRPFERKEFEAVVDMMHRAEGNTPFENWAFPLVMLIQVHLIARIDDAFKSKKQWYKANNSGPGFFLRLPWSKSVTDKRDSPFQLVLGGDVWRLCILIHFAIFFEVAGRSSAWREGEMTFFNGEPTKKNWKKAKGRASRVLKTRVLDKPSFKSIYSQTSRSQQSSTGATKTGAHSNRKYGKTRARRRGNVSKDNADIRGRWKSDNKKASSRYEDSTVMPFPDAQCACELAFDIPITYELAPYSGLCKEFVVREVNPHTAAVFGEDIAYVLGKALLWACFDDEAKEYVEPTLCTRVRNAVYIAEQTRHAGPNRPIDNIPNPVVKLALHLEERNEQAFFTTTPLVPTAPSTYTNNNNNNAMATAVPPPQQQQYNFQQLEQRLVMLERRNASLEGTVKELTNQQRMAFERQTARERKNDRLLKQIAASPLAHCRTTNTTTNTANGGADQDMDVDTNHQLREDARLSKGPRDLDALWREYEYGLDNNIAAKNFGYRERGRVSSLYGKRNKVWQLIKKLMIEQEITHHDAINKIHDKYGPLSCTKMIRAITKETRSFNEVFG